MDVQPPGGPDEVGGRKISLRPVVDRVAAAVTSPLDRAFDQVFERQVEVRSVDQGEQMLDALGARDTARANVGTWVALAASLRPIIVRVARSAQRTSKVTRFSGAGRLAVWGVTGTMAAARVVETSKLGVSELQVMAAFLATRVRERGYRPSSDAVAVAALSLYTKPGRRLSASQVRKGLVSAAARRWVLDAFRPDADEARRRRTRARLTAIASLPDDELLQLVDAIDVIDVDVAPRRAGLRRSLRRGG